MVQVTKTVVDISHESLMRLWQRLKVWAEKEAGSAQTYRRVAESAALWKAGMAGLMRDPELTHARHWQESEAPNAAWAARYGSGFDDAIAFREEAHLASVRPSKFGEALRRWWR